jgi:hypothetical protein
MQDIVEVAVMMLENPSIAGTEFWVDCGWSLPFYSERRPTPSGRRPRHRSAWAVPWSERSAGQRRFDVVARGTATAQVPRRRRERRTTLPIAGSAERGSSFEADVDAHEPAPTTRPCEAVYAAASEGFHDGQVVLEMSTIAPETVREIEPTRARGAGATLLDAPVSGSVPGGRARRAADHGGRGRRRARRAPPAPGGAVEEDPAHGRARRRGRDQARRRTRSCHGLAVALSESLVLAEKAGVERSAAYEVFASGAAAAPRSCCTSGRRSNRPEETPVAFHARPGRSRTST